MNALPEFRRSLRMFWREPAVTLAVCVTLALGVGANAAVFGLVDKLLFRRPPHVADPDNLFRVTRSTNYVQYAKLRASAGALDVATYVETSLTKGTGAEATTLTTDCVSSEYFRVLGTTPLRGRNFESSEDSLGGPAVTIISAALWNSDFGRDDGVIGRSLTLGGREYTIVGVAPSSFSGLALSPVDTWIPLTANGQACSFTGDSLLASNTGSWLTTVARLRSGASREQADTEIMRVLGPQRSASATAPRGELESAFQLEPGLRKDGQVAVWLGGGVIAVLIVACLNVACLLCIRGVGRRQELAMRLNLGATRGRVLREFLVEHGTLTVASTILAMLFGVLTVRLLARFFPFVRTSDVIQPRVLGWTALAALCASILSGVIPLVQAASIQASDTIRAGRAVVGGASRIRNTFLVVQVSVALTLIIGSGVFVRSLRQVRMGTGLDLARTAIVKLNMERSGHQRDQDVRHAFDALVAQARRVPGVAQVALSSGTLLGSRGKNLLLPMRQRGDSLSQRGSFQTFTSVSPDYFSTIGTRIVHGREFTSQDTTGTAPVAIVDEAFAAELWPGQNPLGQCLEAGVSCREVVGISEPRRGAVITKVTHEVFGPIAQDPNAIPQMMLIRFTRSASDQAFQLTAALRTAAPNLLFLSVTPVASLVDVQTRSWRLGATLFGFFGAITSGLAILGVYGSTSFSVKKRTAELGVRMALGATPEAIRRLVLREGMMPVAIGWLTGTLLGIIGIHYLRNVLYGSADTDVIVFATASAVVLIGGVLGCFLPALRAASTSPVIALRQD